MYIRDVITEYDIEHANISIMLDINYINEKTYKEMEKMDKKKRVVKVGLMMKEDRNLYNLLQTGFNKYIDLFIINNKIETSNILEINHDAIWLIGRLPKILEFNKIRFIQKNKFTSLYQCNIKKAPIQFFYDSEKDKIKTRGFNNETSDLLDKIKEILLDKEFGDEDSVYTKLHQLNKEVKKNKYEEMLNNIKNTTILNRMIKDLL